MFHVKHFYLGILYDVIPLIYYIDIYEYMEVSIFHATNYECGR